MNGLMMGSQLTLTSIMEYAKRVYSDSEIVSVTADNPSHRYTYQEAFVRVNQLANALQEFGIQAGDRIATLAWNDHRHFELYYAISCSGAVCHTINPRLFPEQIDYILNHAKDRVVFTDPMFVPLLERQRDKLPHVEKIIVLTTDELLPESSLDLVSYEGFIAGAAQEFDWPELDENTASSLCYTSGTTGNPKGVLYSHRSTLLHSYAINMPDCMGLSIRDTVLPLVPMFHVNAWGLPYAAPMVGSKIVFPGPKMADGEALQKLIEHEQITLSAGVPTIWLALSNYLKQSGKKIESLERIVVGGAACPPSILQTYEQDYGVRVHVAWGMTEISPLGSFNSLKPGMEDLPADELLKTKLMAGRMIYGVDARIIDPEGKVLDWDGEQFGELQVRGPWVASCYYGMDVKDSTTEDGWFTTGDIAIISKDGYIQITDRSKDVIKSGGEWISSIDIENIAQGHPGVAEAAVIGVPHEKWTERPVLILVKNDQQPVDEQSALDWLKGKIASWWMPDKVFFVDEIPHTATGKISKKDLRVEFKDVKL